MSYGTPDFELAEKMEAALVLHAAGGVNANKPVKQRTVPRVSIIAGRCPQKIAHYKNGTAEDPMRPDSAAAFSTGHNSEDMILDHLESALGFKFDRWHTEDDGAQFRCEDGERVLCDGCIDGPSTRQYRVTTDWYTGAADAVSVERGIWADAKTAKDVAFKIKLERAQTEGVGEDYHAQQQMYGVPLQEIFGKPFKCVVPFYRIGGKKGDRIYLPFWFDADPDALLPLKAMAQEAMLPNPRKAFKATDWNCQYCSYFGACWGGK